MEPTSFSRLGRIILQRCQLNRLSKINVSPIAFESLGVRSMCTYAETPNVKILLDAGVSLGPLRFGLPPHPKEYESLKQRRNLILEFAEKSDLVTVSHYHFDHHTPSFVDWVQNWSSPEIAEKTYKGKLVFMKSFQSQVNFSQRRRGWLFSITSGKHAQKLEVADDHSYIFGETSIKFSTPVSHGPESSELGYVLMTVIGYGDEKILFAPDVQGPISQTTLRTILAEEPQLAIVGGPPLYLVDFKTSRQEMESATNNLMSLVKQVPTVILDHHLLRDEKWEEYAQPLFNAASEVGHRVFTAAGYLGIKNSLLESQRKIFFETEPPNKEFMKWTRIPVQKRKLSLPPL